MSINNGLPELISNTGITGLVVYVMYKIIAKLIDRIPVASV